MKTIILGKGGPRMSQFGLGAMSFAGIYGSASEADSHEVLDAMQAAGVSHIDTANVYGGGRSEEIVGSWLAARPGVRDNLVIATKAGITTSGDKRFDNSAAYLALGGEGQNRRDRVFRDCTDVFAARPCGASGGGCAV